MKYNIKMLSEEICFVDFEMVFERGMTFLRSQEYKENPKYAGKSFSLLEFISDYGTENGKFSYPEDWEGFNVSFYDIDKALKMAFKIKDYNRYDIVMDMIVDEAYSLSPAVDYFISCDPSDKKVLDHELAHAFYHIDSKYKKKMDGLIESNLEYSNEIENEIKKQYHLNVLRDEIQACMVPCNSHFKELFDATMNRHKITLP